MACYKFISGYGSAKYCENRLRFPRVIDKSLLPRFFYAQQVYINTAATMAGYAKLANQRIKNYSAHQQQQHGIVMWWRTTAPNDVTTDKQRQHRRHHYHQHAAAVAARDRVCMTSSNQQVVEGCLKTTLDHVPLRGWAFNVTVYQEA